MYYFVMLTGQVNLATARISEMNSWSWNEFTEFLSVGSKQVNDQSEVRCGSAVRQDCDPDKHSIQSHTSCRRLTADCVTFTTDR